MTAATSSAAGKAGMVPAPAAGAQEKFLCGDGTWRFPILESYDAALAHKERPRCKYLGTSITAAQLAAIRDGSFTDLYLGDYWIIDGVTWRVVDINYWLHLGSTAFSKPHLAVMPDEALYQWEMNNTASTASGFIAATMYKEKMTILNQYLAGIFGSALLSHEVTIAYASSGSEASYSQSWYNVQGEIPTEIMLYGSHIKRAGTPSESEKTQLALFRIAPWMLVCHTKEGERCCMWTRNVASTDSYAALGHDGIANALTASSTAGVRPVFAIG